MQPVTRIEVVPAHLLPDEFRHLAWDTFFASRGRGLSLDAHFPWLSDASDPALAITAVIGGAAAAMLIVRPGRVSVEETCHQIATIGLVCTDPAWRGRGLASRLISAALDAAKDTAETALLWTRQAAFYEPMGFETADHAVMGLAQIVANDSMAPTRHDLNESEFSESPIFAGRRGIPTFVERVGVHASSDSDASVAIGESNHGDAPILLDWQGDPAHVLDVIGGLGSETIRWNGYENDPLITLAMARGHRFSLQPARLAMWHRLSDDAPSLDALSRVPISILDRF